MTHSPERRVVASQDWVLRARSLLETSASELDGATLSRLNRARQSAIGQLDAPPRRLGALRWLGAGAVAAGLALLLWRGMLPSALPQGGLAPLAEAPAVLEPAALPVAAPDFELLADPDSFALLEDMEFYAWLQSEEDRGG